MLRRRDLRLGLISNTDPVAAELWKRTPMAPNFHAAVFSSQVYMRKPDPRIYVHTAGLLGVEPSRCLFIGDGSNRELSGALEARMEAAQIKVTYEDDETLRLLGREEWKGPTLESFHAILKLLDLQPRRRTRDLQAGRP
jgi:putative hydrolase of the HAD superfamily